MPRSSAAAASQNGLPMARPYMNDSSARRAQPKGPGGGPEHPPG